MIKARCIDPGDTTQLYKGDLYYLFENGPGKYYVSRFNNPNAHFGCFDQKYFDLQPAEREEWPPEPQRVDPQLEQGKIYIAKLIWRRPGYRNKGLHYYFIKPRNDHAYFYYDEYLQRCGGCFPLWWFGDIREATIPEIIESLQPIYEELPADEWEQMSLF